MNASSLRQSRRSFLAALPLITAAACTTTEQARLQQGEPVIDIHQHTNYAGRSDEELIRHQRRMGVTTSVLLPAGRYYGLDARCGGNESCHSLARKLPGEFVFFANELPYLGEARPVITSWLAKGACGIGEQKFRVLSDSRHLANLASIAQEFNVPILLHFQFDDYNMDFERFHRTLEKFPKVNFIGHAQTWWGNIDKNHSQPVLYPKGKVTPGGLTDRFLSDYPNIFGDLSAGSGLNALLRDEEHTRGFLERHQDKLLYGSDCDDKDGFGPKCQGSQTLATVRRLASSKTIERKILFHNASRLLRLKQGT